MEYKKIVKGTFVSRPNRFIAKVIIDGCETTVHVKNTGRCKELLLEGATVYLEDFSENMGTRKFRYSLIAAQKNELLINMDSYAPNVVVREALYDRSLTLPNMSELCYIIPEAAFGNSRLDFYVEDNKGNKGFVEVKGVTLENDGVVSFPDAPTLRGVRHVNELCEIANQGLNAYIIFVIQMGKAKYFTPNDLCHREFGEALRNAERNGVNILAYSCEVTPESLNLLEEIPVKL